VRTALRANKLSTFQKFAIVVTGVGLVTVLAVVLLHPIQRYWLHGPLVEARVRIDAEAGGRWRKPTSGLLNPTLIFRYLVRTPDGSRAYVTLPHRAPIGSTIEIAFFRGAVTGKVFVITVKEVDVRQP
jgi:hypothetical protein